MAKYKKNSPSLTRRAWVRDRKTLRKHQAENWISVAEVAKLMAKSKKNVVLRDTTKLFFDRIKLLAVFFRNEPDFVHIRGKGYKELLTAPWDYVFIRKAPLKRIPMASSYLFFHVNLRFFWKGPTSYWRLRTKHLGQNSTPFYLFMRIFRGLSFFCGRISPIPWDSTRWSFLRKAHNTLRSNIFIPASYSPQETLLDPYNVYPRTFLRKQHFFLYRQRFLLKDTPLVRRNYRLKNSTLLSNKLYRTLLRPSFRAKEASNFFMQKKKVWAKSFRSLSFDYNQIFSDVVMFKTWSTQKFWINHIRHKKLISWYVGCKQKHLNLRFDQARTTKQRKLAKLYNCFQYSLFALLYSSLQVLGVRSLFSLVKSGFVWVNGLVELNPFRPCYKGDFIQLDIFKVLRKITTIEEHWAVWPFSEKHVSSHRKRVHDRFFSYIPTLFHTAIPKAPRSFFKGMLRYSSYMYFRQAISKCIRNRMYATSIRTRQLNSGLEFRLWKFKKVEELFPKREITALNSIAEYMDKLKGVVYPAIKVGNPVNMVDRRRFWRRRKANQNQLDEKGANLFYRYLRQRYVDMTKPYAFRYKFRVLSEVDESYKSPDVMHKVDRESRTAFLKVDFIRATFIIRNLENHYEPSLEDQQNTPTLADITKAVSETPWKVREMSRNRKRNEEKARRRAERKEWTHPYRPTKWGGREGYGRSFRRLLSPNKLPLYNSHLIGSIFRLKKATTLKTAKPDIGKTKTKKPEKNTPKVAVTRSNFFAVCRSIIFNTLETINARHASLSNYLISNSVRARIGLLKKSLLTGADTFALCLISTQYLREGRKSYLNEATLRFFVSY